MVVSAQLGGVPGAGHCAGTIGSDVVPEIVEAEAGRLVRAIVKGEGCVVVGLDEEVGGRGVDVVAVGCAAIDAGEVVGVGRLLLWVSEYEFVVAVGVVWTARVVVGEVPEGVVSRVLVKVASRHTLGSNKAGRHGRSQEGDDRPHSESVG